ncbi:hypothetical protein Btru_071231 [Bulinus truncatus]|nr:hypothetical protein Btru_071231 [Bulinus truncatus]
MYSGSEVMTSRLHESQSNWGRNAGVGGNPPGVPTGRQKNNNKSRRSTPSPKLRSTTAVRQPTPYRAARETKALSTDALKLRAWRDAVSAKQAAALAWQRNAKRRVFANARTMLKDVSSYLRASSSGNSLNREAPRTTIVHQSDESSERDCPRRRRRERR